MKNTLETVISPFPNGTAHNEQPDPLTKISTCFSRRIRSENSKVVIKIDKSKTDDNFNVHSKAIYPWSLKFEISDRHFTEIDGNYTDHDISSLLNQEDCAKEISFLIKDKEKTIDCIPPEKWQQHFVECIESGLINTSNAPYEKLMNLLADSINYTPTCHQFVNFMEHGSYFSLHFVTAELIEDTNQLDSFVNIGLYKGNNIIHSFIYMADGVCVGKMGANNIIFHTINDIVDYYTSRTEEAVQLRLLHFGLCNISKILLTNTAMPYLHHYLQNIYSKLTGHDMKILIPESKFSGINIFN